MSNKKIDIATPVRVRAYAVITDAVERACAYGVERAHKHTDTPSRTAIAEECERAVMSALVEVLDFGDEP